MEIWRPVVGYEGLYEVSDQGRIRSLGAKGIIRKQYTRDKKPKYPTVRLSKNGKVRNWRIGNLVCAAFHGPCPVGLQLRHENDVHADNRAANLSWGTRAENDQDRQRNGGFVKMWETRRALHQ